MKLQLRKSVLGAALCLISVAWAENDEPQVPHIPAFDMQKCVNMGNSMEAPRDSNWGHQIIVDDFADIRSMGIDTVRVPLKWSDYVGPAPDYLIEAAFTAEVQRVVDAALHEDLNVILNIHHFHDLTEDPMANMRKLLAIWRQIATAYADYPDDLWFEVLNEPNGNLSGDLMRGAQKIGVLAIRESNPDRIIILGGENWSTVHTLNTNMPPLDENIVYTFHYYDPFDFTHQKASWLGENMPKGTRRWGDKADRERLETDVQKAVAYRQAINRPVFLGEFGVYSEVRGRDRATYIGAVRTAMESAAFPWCLWAYTNTFALYDRDTDRHDRRVVDALGVDLPRD